MSHVSVQAKSSAPSLWKEQDIFLCGNETDFLKVILYSWIKWVFFSFLWTVCKRELVGNSVSCHRRRMNIYIFTWTFKLGACKFSLWTQAKNIRHQLTIIISVNKGCENEVELAEWIALGLSVSVMDDWIPFSISWNCKLVWCSLQTMWWRYWGRAS